MLTNLESLIRDTLVARGTQSFVQLCDALKGSDDELTLQAATRLLMAGFVTGDPNGYTVTANGIAAPPAVRALSTSTEDPAPAAPVSRKSGT